MRHDMLRILALIAGLALVPTACSSTGGTAQNTYVSEGEDGEVEEYLGDPGLARALVMESIRTTRKNGLLHVQFNLRSTKSSNLPIEWTIAWLDGEGLVLDTPRHWSPASLGGKGFETIARTAPIPEAVGYRLGVRRPNTVH